jgi:RNA polymerase primary sigma factor
MNTPTATRNARPPRSVNAWMRGRTKTIPGGIDPRLTADINAVGLLTRDEERVLTTAIVAAVRACWDACLGAGPSAAQRHSIHADAIIALGKSVAEETDTPDPVAFTLTAPVTPAKTPRRRPPSADTGPAMQPDEVPAALANIIPADLNWCALRAAQASARVFAVATQAAEVWRRTLATTAAHLDRLVSKMTAANMRLVMHIAKKERAGLPFADLVQEGSTGLLKAIRRFDPTRGFAFSTFASHWIRADMGRANDDKSELIRRPVHILDAGPKVRAARAEFVNNHGREPTTAEIAGRLLMTEDRVAAAMGPTRVRSADAPVGVRTRRGGDNTDSRHSLGDIIADNSLPSPIDLIDATNTEATLHAALALLPEREQDIITRHHGLGAAHEETLVDIGRTMTPPLSRERIRQIESAACTRIRKMAPELGRMAVSL